MYDKQASSQNFPPQGITSKFLANQVNGIVRLGPAEHMGLVGIYPSYRGSPTYMKITNAVPYFRGFGLCTRKWGIFALVGDLLQSH